MKVNDIKALDYQCQGDSLTIPFAETSVEAVLALDAAVLTVKTDAGDTVEVLAGYALKTATVAAADPTSVTAVYTRAVDGTAAALDTISDRLVQAEQNTHEGGFAGAVFAQQGMHFAFAQLEGDVVVCLDTGELLGNIQHLNDKIFSQSAHAPFTNQSIGAALPPR